MQEGILPWFSNMSVSEIADVNSDFYIEFQEALLYSCGNTWLQGMIEQKHENVLNGGCIAARRRAIGLTLTKLGGESFYTSMRPCRQKSPELRRPRKPIKGVSNYDSQAFRVIRMCTNSEFKVQVVRPRIL